MNTGPALFWIVVIAAIVPAVFITGCTDTAIQQEENGTVQVASSPPGAEIYLGSEYRGTTPATITGIPAGRYTLGLRLDGYDRWSAPLEVTAGGVRNISATLTAIPATVPPVTYATAVAPASRQGPGSPEIHIDGYWTFPQGVDSAAAGPVPLIIHADGYNTGDADAQQVTASAKVSYDGREVCWKTVFFGTLAAGGHAPASTMVSCSFPSGMKPGEIAIRFDNIVVTP